MPIILVQNEVTVGGKYDHWEDDEGVKYHFPNQYINKIRKGDWFVYYRGSRRANNKRGIPEYFGFGRIGDISPDPLTDFTKAKKDLRWYCEIYDYTRFSSPVPFKIANQPFEQIHDNQWSVAVRNIKQDIFQRILAMASFEVIDGEPIVNPSSKVIPPIDSVDPVIVTGSQELLVPTKASSNKNIDGQSKENKSFRYSRFAKLYGDHSENIVYKVLLNNRCYQLRSVAKDKLGWDIEYYENDRLVAVEVKGTSGKRFLSIEITANEWKAAESKADNYYLYLVADCLSKQPKIQVIKNPYSLYLKKQLTIDPLLYRLGLKG
ncbi:MAG TPA: DUF3883 domain-containing protein [Chitinophagaceae bacterium]